YFGAPHAEVECLRRYKGEMSGTTMYTNLEPCTHYGKTPPCSDLIIQRGIEKVVVGMRDPNPRVAGKGITRLRRAGIEVVVGVLEDQAAAMNKSFIKHIRTKIPYVHVKIAQTQDGFIGKNTGPLRYITSLQSRKMVHRWRAEYDAVLVGAGTLRADNPELNVRLASGNNPAVVILDGQFRLSGKEKIFASARQRRVFLCTKHLMRPNYTQKRIHLLEHGVDILEFPIKNGRINLKAVLKKLYRNNIGSVLVEGGQDVFMQFIDHNLVDELSIFTAPRRFGSGVRAFTGERTLDSIIEQGNFISSRVGTDILMTGRIH
ncbi:MAG: bifunctional diaminohydroxyphosphoribosylaminopyrimidine deaminase/5-amino-6-(5-phosphoribosylamino)uracil reductase RibD, partial [bacterium]